MSTKGLIAGTVMLLISLSVAAMESSLMLPNGKPGQTEFVTAAKRALVSRHYETWMIGEDVVIGKYKSRVEVALILTDDAVVIRDTDLGGVSSDTIKKYMRNLHRDLSYELAEYAIAPAVASDPAKMAALTAFMNPENNIAPEPSATAVITGRYQSQISSSSNYVFNKQKDRRIVVTFEQKGAEITGMSADVNLKITGTITGDKIKFFTWPSDITANELKGEWKISADGRRLEGKWGYSAGGGDWNLTKIE